MELIADTQLSMDRIFSILVKVRENDHIESLNFFSTGEEIESLSREELETKLLKSLNIDTTQVARIFGKSFDRTELIRLAHFAISEANSIEQEKGKKRKKSSEPGDSKKAKQGESDTVDLHKEIQELKQSIDKDSVAFALRDVKEYAARSDDLNVDTLHMKLMHLDETGRRTQHADKELFSKVLERFLFYKKKLDDVGNLVSILLSSPTDARIHEKEHKFLKLHRKDKKPEAADKPAAAATDHNKVDWQAMYMQLMYSTQFGMPRFQTPSLFPIRPPPMPRRQPPLRPRLNAYTGCHQCGDMSHYRVDCPRLK